MGVYFSYYTTFSSPNKLVLTAAAAPAHGRARHWRGGHRSRVRVLQRQRRQVQRDGKRAARRTKLGLFRLDLRRPVSAAGQRPAEPAPQRTRAW
jgi:hypothetical protein